MEICSIGFLLACVGIVVVFHLLPFARLRRLFLSVVNGLFVVSLVPNIQSGIWFVIFLGGTYGSLALVRARPGRTLVWTTIVIVVALFTYVKRYSFIPAVVPVELWWPVWSQPVAVVGLSYMLFKFIHMLVDEWQGQLSPFTFLSYLNYQLAFFTLVAGPIQRYNDFKRGWEEMDLQPAEAREGWLAWNRVLIGMVKMRVLAPLVLYASNQASKMNPSDPNHAWYSLLVFYLYPVQLYFNFSGYTDAAIGSAQLLGFKLPENFNRPYLARNVLDFWNRWHMSLTHWIRDYIFMASYKAAATKYPRWARSWSYGLLFVALFITGIWHGTTSGFVVFGVLNGIGAAANRAYGDVLRAVLGRSGVERYLGNRLIRCLAIAATFHYVCLCHLAFSSYITMSVWDVSTEVVYQVLEIVQAMTRFQWTAADLAVPVAVSLLLSGLWKADALGDIAARLSAWLMRGTLRVPVIVCIQIVIMTFIFFLDWTFDQEPPHVVYMRF
jgi:D-alanyl-lipoteichoic acid acyltransferase DltB (MBOAT superfamily)